MEILTMKVKRSVEKLEGDTLAGPALTKQRKKHQSRSYNLEQTKKKLEKAQKIQKLLEESKIEYQDKLKSVPLFPTLPTAEEKEIDSGNNNNNANKNENDSENNSENKNENNSKNIENNNENNNTDKNEISIKDNEQDAKITEDTEIEGGKDDNNKSTEKEKEKETGPAKRRRVAPRGKKGKKTKEEEEEEEERAEEEEEEEKAGGKKGSKKGAKKGGATAPPLQASDIIGITVPQMKAMLKERGVAFTSKHKKSDLQKLLSDLIGKSANSTEKGEKAATKRKRSESEEEHKAPKKIHTSKPKDAKPSLTLEEKIAEQNYTKYLVAKYGTKMGNVLAYLRRLWIHTPEAKIIIFSKYNKVLNLLGELFAESKIEYAFVEGNAYKRIQAISSFKTEANVSVILMNIETASSGTNLIAASHIFLIDPAKGTKEVAKGIEQQAIGRAYRQGQTKPVTVVRFVARDTLEYDRLVAQKEEEEVIEEGVKVLHRQGSHSGRNTLQRTSSLL
eukprot:Phypoly_transcript_06020.p1 GENE.Phypoly_transcript_06020~~Phypoly_transcript_06020.p1  ORF type:complete len:561 (+),score=164.54 Phypoly_transcript_06020:171-1685(+)